MKYVKMLVPVLLLLIGAAVLAYPPISNYVNQKNSSYALQELDRHLENVEEQEALHQRSLAQAYNARLLQGEEGEDYASVLDFGNGVMGAVEIPEINVSLPIYHGVSEEVLAKGVGHMPSSAFPIGGEGNHAVLTGHTGLPSAKLFTDLTKLQEGDVFHIRILGESISYRVDQVKVVLPSEGEDLLPQPGKDYCTLLTCTPYGVNSHRLLVRGERVEEAQDEAITVMQTEPMKREIPWGVIAAVSFLVFCVSAGTAVWLLKRKR